MLDLPSCISFITRLLYLLISLALFIHPSPSSIDHQEFGGEKKRKSHKCTFQQAMLLPGLTTATRKLGSKSHGCSSSLGVWGPGLGEVQTGGAG